jgi:hypothetical protein
MSNTRRRSDDDEAESELLQDGAIGRVRMMMRDSQGTPAGRRPGFVRLDDETAYMRGRVQKQLAYESYQLTLEDSWKGPVSEVADEQVDTAVADAAAHANHTQPRDMRQVYEREGVAAALANLGGVSGGLAATVAQKRFAPTVGSAINTRSRP